MIPQSEQAQRKYDLRNARVFPLQSKIPRCRWKEVAKPTSDPLSMASAFGVVCEDPFCVVDFDDEKSRADYPSGCLNYWLDVDHVTFEQLRASFGLVKTPHGFHLYCASDPAIQQGQGFTTPQGKQSFIDVRANGRGYVVGAGSSIAADGKGAEPVGTPLHYKALFNGSEIPLTPLQAVLPSLYAMLAKAAPKTSNAPLLGAVYDGAGNWQPRSFEQGLQALKNAAPQTAHNVLCGVCRFARRYRNQPDYNQRLDQIRQAAQQRNIPSSEVENAIRDFIESHRSADAINQAAADGQKTPRIDGQIILENKDDYHVLAAGVAGKWLESRALINDEWHEKTKAGNFVPIAKGKLFADLKKCVLSFAPCYETARGEKPLVINTYLLKELLIDLVNEAVNAGKWLPAANPGACYMGGVERLDVFLVDGGRAIRIDAQRRRIEPVNEPVIALNTCLFDFPQTAKNGRLVTAGDLSEGHVIRRFLQHICGQNVVKQRRFLAQIGAIVYRRGTDNDTSKSLIFWYGDKGAGKDKVVDIIKALLGSARDLGIGKHSSLTRENRFANSEVYTHCRVLFDDVTIVKEHQNALLEMSNNTHNFEQKGKQAQTIEAQPVIFFLSNFPPPLLNNGEALARRLCPVRFVGTENDGLFELYKEIIQSPETLRILLSASLDAFLDAKSKGYGVTPDDQDLQQSVIDSNPYKAFIEKFFEPRNNWESRLARRKIISLYKKSLDFNGNTNYIWQQLARCIKSTFGDGAIELDDHRNYWINLRIKEDYFKALRWAESEGEQITILDWQPDQPSSIPQSEAVEIQAENEQQQQTASDNWQMNSNSQPIENNGALDEYSNKHAVEACNADQARGLAKGVDLRNGELPANTWAGIARLL